MLLHTGPPSTSDKCPVPEALDVLVRNELLDEQVPIVLIELPLLCGQEIVVQGVAGTQRGTLTVSSDQHVCQGEELSSESSFALSLPRKMELTETSLNEEH